MTPWVSTSLPLIIYCTNHFLSFTADCVDGEVRLMEGEFEWEGRLEMCFGQRWGTINSDGWTSTNSEIVCQDLGYTVPDTGL